MHSLDPFLFPAGTDGDDLSIEPDFGSSQAMHNGMQSTFGSPAEIALVRRFIGDIRDKLDTLERMVAKQNTLGAEDVERLLLHNPKPRTPSGKVIEGVFDGEQMMGADGKQYTVPSNYASKSKLVEGDILKLTITDDGTFIYKQIGPIERERVVATLATDAVTGDYLAISRDQKWSLLRASVTYLRAEPGDQLVVLLPKNAPSRWAAIENVMRTQGEVREETGVAGKRHFPITE